MRPVESYAWVGRNGPGLKGSESNGSVRQRSRTVDIECVSAEGQRCRQVLSESPADACVAPHAHLCFTREAPTRKRQAAPTFAVILENWASSCEHKPTQRMRG